ncbi:MAG: helix-turn-helix domain-containing protein [Thermoplasmata archaeon]
MLGVSNTTLINWAKKGLIHSINTLGGHKRYFKTEIEKIINEQIQKKA